MRAPHYAELTTLLQDNISVEKQINPDTSNFDDTVNKLHEYSHKLVELKQHFDKDNEEAARTLITIAKRCNFQRIKILAKISARQSWATQYTYQEYRQNIEELKELTVERDSLIESVLGASEGSSGLELSDSMQLEDAMLIRLLSIVSVVDGKVHRKEKKIIKERYRRITGHAIKNEALDGYLTEISIEWSDVLKQFGIDAQKLFPKVRGLMLSTAIDVALADNKLYDEEREVLLQIMEIFEIEDQQLHSQLSKS